MSLESDAVLFPLEPSKVLPNTEPTIPNCQIQPDGCMQSFQTSTNTKSFVEREELILTPFEYQRTGNDPGLVLIFNQEKFHHGQDTRIGTDKDCNEIIICMTRLGFNIDKDNIFTDLSKDEILKKIDHFIGQDLSKYNCLIVFFLSHGYKFNDLYAFDTSLRTSDLWEKFSSCKDLMDKPKLFIFQACKGSDSSKIPADAQSKIDLVPASTFTSKGIGPDMLIVYSTTEGNVSMRDPRNGTWFIQELCKNFLSYGRRDDVVSLIMRTAKCVCANYFHYKNNSILKQMPVLISTLRKRFYLMRSKDRNIWYKLLKNQEEIKSRIENLEKVVAELVTETQKKK